MKILKIFTDGASKGNPGPGGWGAVIFDEQEVIEIGAREQNTTNNRMELSAALEALKITNEGTSVELYTDSSYLINGITKWVRGWQLNNWLTSKKEPVLNKDLWVGLVEIVQGRKVSWYHVPGHSGVILNERVDHIASTFGEGDEPNLFNGLVKEYPIDLSKLDLAKLQKGEEKRKGKVYSYVSLVDGKIATHKKWDECKSRVDGKKAKFRKVFSSGEEQEVIKEFLK
jgi:ribonuclease HI